jgi:Ser/Thr protein kinase RdoA (MazF antagonist)
MHDLANISSKFLIPGDFRSAEPYGSGHINDTYVATFDQSGTTVRYIFQRINQHVFPDPGKLMENVERVCAHAQGKLKAAENPEASRYSLTLIPTRTGGNWHVEGPDHWRCYPFIEKAQTYDAIETLEQATAAAKAFGRFQRMLADLPGERLYETIPDFHHTRRRYERLMEVIEADPKGRASFVSEEIEFVRTRKADASIIVDALESGRIPERITHNDTKLNNVMIDDLTGEGVCVIDLDTIMPGTALSDFGDMVRTATNPAQEDTQDLSEVRMRMEYFQAIAQGYLEGCSGCLTPAELDLLPIAGKLMTFECGMRFLTDFLEGDVYFKTHRDQHNLDRCRSQFKLVTSIEQQMDEMKQLIDKLVAVK